MTLTMADITSALLALDQGEFTSLQLLDAAAVAGQHYPHHDPAQPALLLGLADPDLTRRLAATLLQAYPPDHPATLLLPPQVADKAMLSSPSREWHAPRQGTPNCHAERVNSSSFHAATDQRSIASQGFLGSGSASQRPTAQATNEASRAAGPDASAQTAGLSMTEVNPAQADSQRRSITLGELGQGTDLGAGVHLYLPPRAGAATCEALQDVVAQLRAPAGCPWDRALTWPKLRASLLEESYELLAALDADDPAKVTEEQGDLLLQIALQAQIATEAGRFRLPDVIARIVEKLIRRHPHVFGDAMVSDEAEVLANWEAIKAAERARNGERRSPLAGVPAGLPALAQAEAYLDRMSRLRPAAAPEAPWASLAALAPDAPLDADTLGEALFDLVAWSLARGVEAESALRRTNARFASEIESASRGGFGPVNPSAPDSAAA